MSRRSIVGGGPARDAVGYIGAARTVAYNQVARLHGGGMRAAELRTRATRREARERARATPFSCIIRRAREPERVSGSVERPTRCKRQRPTTRQRRRRSIDSAASTRATWDQLESSRARARAYLSIFYPRHRVFSRRRRDIDLSYPRREKRRNTRWILDASRPRETTFAILGNRDFIGSHSVQMCLDALVC